MFDPGNSSLRTDRWRYIRYADGSEELYDLKQDPAEWNNLAGSERFYRQKQSLQQRLAESLTRFPSE
jgi:hypothetical protein